MLRGTTCGHKAKDSTPSITWKREASLEEALGDLPFEDEKVPSSIRPILKLFQRPVPRQHLRSEAKAHMGFLSPAPPPPPPHTHTICLPPRLSKAIQLEQAAVR